MNPFPPFFRSIDGHRELMQLHDPVFGFPIQPLLNSVPPKVVRVSFYLTRRIVAIQSETRRI